MGALNEDTKTGQRETLEFSGTLETITPSYISCFNHTL